VRPGSSFATPSLGPRYAMTSTQRRQFLPPKTRRSLCMLLHYSFYTISSAAPDSYSAAHRSHPFPVPSLSINVELRGARLFDVTYAAEGADVVACWWCVWAKQSRAWCTLVDAWVGGLVLEVYEVVEFVILSSPIQRWLRARTVGSRNFISCLHTTPLFTIGQFRWKTHILQDVVGRDGPRGLPDLNSGPSSTF
jgi:hypothetical protein